MKKLLVLLAFFPLFASAQTGNLHYDFTHMPDVRDSIYIANTRPADASQIMIGMAVFCAVSAGFFQAQGYDVRALWIGGATLAFFGTVTSFGRQP